MISAYKDAVRVEKDETQAETGSTYTGEMQGVRYVYWQDGDL
jgi:hypothetical protein